MASYTTSCTLGPPVAVWLYNSGFQVREAGADTVWDEILAFCREKHALSGCISLDPSSEASSLAFTPELRQQIISCLQFFSHVGGEDASSVVGLLECYWETKGHYAAKVGRRPNLEKFGSLGASMSSQST